MKKLIRNLIFILLCTFILIVFPKKVEAKVSFTDIITGGEFFRDESNNDDIFNESKQKESVLSIYNVALGIGIIAAVLVGIIIGVKFITTGVEGQAKIKEKILPYVIGCIVVFGAFGIWRAAINITDRAIPTEEFKPVYGPTIPDEIYDKYYKKSPNDTEGPTIPDELRTDK